LPFIEYVCKQLEPTGCFLLAVEETFRETAQLFENHKEVSYVSGVVLFSPARNHIVA
jgi:hypothetical protein